MLIGILLAKKGDQDRGRTSVFHLGPPTPSHLETKLTLLKELWINYIPASKGISNTACSLSLWRVARGSKHMFLELIHGLFIT